MKHIALTGILLALLGCKSAPAESEMNIAGRCWVWVGDHPFETHDCHLETLTPREGFNNLYRVVMQGFVPMWSAEPVYDYVKALSTAGGTIELESLLWGRITVVPDSEQIRRQIRERAGQFEIRPQVIYTQQTEEGGWEIRIEERYEHFYFGVPSPEWNRQHEASFRRFSHAK